MTDRYHVTVYIDITANSPQNARDLILDAIDRCERKNALNVTKPDNVGFIDSVSTGPAVKIESDFDKRV